MAKIKILNQLANVGGRKGETIVVIECLIINVGSESRWKNGAGIRITALKGKTIISYRRKVLPV